MKDRWKAAVEGAGLAAMEHLSDISSEERQRILARIRSNEPPPVRYREGWSGGRIFQEALVIQHLHARGFCAAAKAMEQPGFYGSFGMTGGDGFSEEAFMQIHTCFKGEAT